MFIGDSLISWKSKKQSTVSKSSAKAEYMAIGSAASEIIWLDQLLKDFRVIPSSTSVLYCDNQAAIHIASNPSFHERTKHLEIYLHSIRDHVNKGMFKLLPVRTQHQLADIFTKPLPAPALKNILSKLSLKNLFA